MQKPSALNDGHRVNYGFGLFLEEFQGLPTIAHSGATAGYRAWLGRIPDKDLSVAVLCNAASANTTEMAHQIFDLYLGQPAPTTPAQPKDPVPGLYVSLRDHGTAQVAVVNGVLTFGGQPARVKARFADSRMFTSSPVYGEDVWERVEPWTPKDLSEFTGNYESEEAETVLRVTLENGKLVIHRRPNDSFPLTPTYKDAFDSELGSIRFLRDGAGRILTLSLGNSRVWDLRFTREADSAIPAR